MWFYSCNSDRSGHIELLIATKMSTTINIYRKLSKLVRIKENTLNRQTKSFAGIRIYQIDDMMEYLENIN